VWFLENLKIREIHIRHNYVDPFSHTWLFRVWLRNVIQLCKRRCSNYVVFFIERRNYCCWLAHETFTFVRPDSSHCTLVWTFEIFIGKSQVSTGEKTSEMSGFLQIIIVVAGLTVGDALVPTKSDNTIYTAIILWHNNKTLVYSSTLTGELWIGILKNFWIFFFTFSTLAVRNGRKCYVSVRATQTDF